MHQIVKTRHCPNWKSINQKKVRGGIRNLCWLAEKDSWWKTSPFLVLCLCLLSFFCCCCCGNDVKPDFLLLGICSGFFPGGNAILYLASIPWSFFFLVHEPSEPPRTTGKILGHDDPAHWRTINSRSAFALRLDSFVSTIPFIVTIHRAYIPEQQWQGPPVWQQS